MRRIPISIVLLAVSVFSSAQDCKDAIAQVRDAWITAWKAQKLDDVMRLYATDATVLDVDGKLYVGHSQIREHFKGLMTPTAIVESAEVVCSGETGFDRGAYSAKGGGIALQGNLKLQGNMRIQGGGNTRNSYVVTLRKDSPTWLIVQQAAVRTE